jgi:hypothetical protein
MPDDEIQDIESVLTLLGGRVVQGSGDFAEFAPELPPAMPDWSPVRTFGGYGAIAGALALPRLRQRFDADALLLSASLTTASVMAMLRSSRMLLLPSFGAAL